MVEPGAIAIQFPEGTRPASAPTVREAPRDSQTATRWESKGDGTYEIEEAEKETRGTDILLYLKEEEMDDCYQQLKELKLEELLL